MNLKNQELFKHTLPISAGAAGTSTLQVTCVSCYTSGTLAVSTTPVTQDIVSEITEILECPIGEIITALGLDLKVDIHDFFGHFEFDISFAAHGTYIVHLWPPKEADPEKQNLTGQNFIGIVPALDLVFNLDAAIDFTTGFEVWIPDAYLIINPITGDIQSSNITEIHPKGIPVKVIAGSACLTASLRFSVRAGLEVEVDGTGLDFEAGVFLGAPGYKACLNTTTDCGVESTESLYVDLGVYARAVVELDYKSLSAGPTAVQTLESLALPSACVQTSTPPVFPPPTSTPIPQPPCGTGLLICQVEDPTRLEAPWHRVSATFPQCYDPALYTCASNFLCPINAPKINGEYACGPYGTTCSSWSISSQTLTGCESNLDWCPSTLLTSIVIPKTVCADNTPTTAYTSPPMTITSPVPLSIFTVPIISAIETVNIYTEVYTRSIWVTTTIITSYLSLETVPLYATASSSYVINPNSTSMASFNSTTMASTWAVLTTSSDGVVYTETASNGGEPTATNVTGRRPFLLLFKSRIYPWSRALLDSGYFQPLLKWSSENNFYLCGTFRLVEMHHLKKAFGSKGHAKSSISSSKSNQSSKSSPQTHPCLGELLFYYINLYLHEARAHDLPGTPTAGNGQKDIRNGVVFATSCWNEVDSTYSGELERKFQELKRKRNFWGGNNSEIFRHDDTKETALAIVDSLLSQNWSVVLEVQQQMIAQRKMLNETRVGLQVQRSISELLDELGPKTKKVRREIELELGRRRNIGEALEEARIRLRNIDLKRTKLEEDDDKLEVNMETLIQEREQLM
ncbi:hypothetical protein BDZ45DRAFT_774574 [Acephala macrosclerotiorum]|nr:hypothetical protein BDZ45DRAFT_774574 [Acephala macrosclerotiorum]